MVEPPDAVTSLEGTPSVTSNYNRLRDRFLGDALVYGCLRAIVSASSLGTAILFSRALGPTDFGRYTLLLSVASLATLLWFSWLGNAAFRHFPAHRQAGTLSQNQSVIARTYAVLAAALFGIAMGLRVVGFGPLAELPPATFWAAVAVLVLSGPFGHITELYRANSQRMSYVIATVSTALMPLGVFLVLSRFQGKSLSVGLMAQAIVPVGGFLGVGTWWARRKAFSIEESVSVIRQYFRYGWPLVGSGLCSWALSVSDRFVVGALHSSHDVGIYTAGYQIGSAPLLFLYAVVMLPLEPLMITAHESESAGKAGELVGLGLVTVLTPAVLVLVLLIGDRKEIATILLGSTYAASASVIPLVGLGIVLFLAAQVLLQICFLIKDTKPIFRNLVVASSVNLVLNVILVPRLSVMGAAFSTAFSYGLYLVLAISSTSGRYPLQIRRRWLSAIAVASVSSGVLLLLTHLSMFAGVLRLSVDVAGTFAIFAWTLLVPFRGDFVTLVSRVLRSSR